MTRKRTVRHPMVRHSVALIAALLGGAAAANEAAASEIKTWHIYCEARVNGQPSTILSANFWPHEATTDYQSALAAAAERFIARSPNTELSGCAGIPFFDPSVAETNRKRTVDLARGIGDSVYFVDMPMAVLPD